MEEPPLFRSLVDVEGPRKSFLISTGLQVCAVALMLVLGTTRTIQKVVKDNVLYMPLLPSESRVNQPVPPALQGGGGGDGSPLPASHGKLPKFALQQFTAPVAVSNNLQPKLAMEPTLIGDPDITAPAIEYPLYGNPLSHYLSPSNGSGSGSGIGDTKGAGGVGSGRGSNYGSSVRTGSDVGAVYGIAEGVTPPILVSKVDPEYTQTGRRGRREGTVQVAAEIDTSGHAVNMRVVRSLGLGLDEEAMKALDQWVFIPARKDGKPVAVEIRVGLTFRIL